MIRLALIGCGRMGQRWLRAIRASDAFELVAIVDPVSPEADVTDIDGAPPFDAAIVATPTPLHHYGVVKNEGFICGRGVLVEKPLAATHDTALALTALADDYRVPLVVGHVERFNPAVRVFLDAIRSGAVGTPEHIGAVREGPRPDPVVPGNNVALDLAVHDLDLLRLAVGPLEVAAASADRDHVVALLSSPSGAQATARATWGAPRCRRLWCMGDRGTVRADLLAGTVHLDGRALPVPPGDALSAQLAAFAHLIETGDPGALCSAEDGAETVRLAEAAMGMGKARRAA